MANAFDAAVRVTILQQSAASWPSVAEPASTPSDPALRRLALHRHACGLRPRQLALQPKRGLACARRPGTLALSATAGATPYVMYCCTHEFR